MTPALITKWIMVVLIVEFATFAVVFALLRDIPRCVYFIAAAALNIAVLFMR